MYLSFSHLRFVSLIIYLYIYVNGNGHVLTKIIMFKQVIMTNTITIPAPATSTSTKKHFTGKMNRESWLQLAVHQLTEKVFEPVGLKVPTVNVSVSLMSGGLRGSKLSNKGGTTLGENYSRSISKGGVNEIFMNPLYFSKDNSSRTLDVLAHEMIHAIDDNKHGHGKVFRDMAIKIGLTGKMTATTATDELKVKLDAIVDYIGEFPHELMVWDNKKKQSTRNVKVECDSCEFSFRTSRKNIELMNEEAPCPCCGSHTDMDEEEGTLTYGQYGTLQVV